MNKIALSPNSLVGVPALDYISALTQAGYDGIGLRMYASPGVNYESVTQPLAGNPLRAEDRHQAERCAEQHQYEAAPARQREHPGVQVSPGVEGTVANIEVQNGDAIRRAASRLSWP